MTKTMMAVHDDPAVIAARGELRSACHERDAQAKRLAALRSVADPAESHEAFAALPEAQRQLAIAEATIIRAGRAVAEAEQTARQARYAEANARMQRKLRTQDQALAQAAEATVEVAAEAAELNALLDEARFVEIPWYGQFIDEPNRESFRTFQRRRLREAGLL